MEVTSDHSKKGIKGAEGTVERVGKDGSDETKLVDITSRVWLWASLVVE